jgi:hypothetical protein
MSDPTPEQQADDWWKLNLAVPDAGREGSISPLAMYLLANDLDFACDMWKEATEGDMYFDALPLCARYWFNDPTFPQRMSESCGRAADRIRAGHVMQIATCTADEVNVWIALAGLREMEVEAFDDDPVALELARREPHSEDFETLVDDTAGYIGEDHDVELLWQPQFDGIESNDTDLEHMRFANLHPRDWFNRFDSVEP